MASEVSLASYSTGRGSCSSAGRSPVVIPSSQLDSNLHQKAAQITKKRHKESEASFDPDGWHDDDPMTPPDVLLERAWKQAQQLISEVDVVRKREEEVSDIFTVCVRCIALSRIVHGDSHWRLAKAHLQLARTYLELKGLLQQAWSHAAKGQGILLAPGSPLKSRDPPFEVTCLLALAHCVLGRVHTQQGELSKASQELAKAKKSFFTAKEKLGEEDAGDVEVELDILTGLARLHLTQEKFEAARTEFANCIDLTRSSYGAESSRLLPLLRGKATTEAHLALYETASQTLQEALEMAEAKYGEESEETAEVLQAQARLGTAQLRAGEQVEQKSVEDKFSRACRILGTESEKAMQCKEEWCLMLTCQADGKERAIPLLKELLAAKTRVHGASSAEVGHTLKMLGTVHLSLGRAGQARDYLQQAEASLRGSLGASHKDTMAVAKALQTIAGSSDDSRLSQHKPRFRTVF